MSLADGQFVRVKFEHLLDNTRDITLFAKPTDIAIPASVEVYTTDGTYIGVFPIIHQDGRYSLVLNNLVTPTDTFDLKIIGNVDIDFITDPNAYWVGGTGNWSNPNKWASSSNGTPGSFGGIPDATTNVFFDASSGGAATILTIDTAATAGSITISGYTGTIVQNANLTITNSGGQSGNYSQTTAAVFTGINPGTNTFSATGNFSVTAGQFRRYTGLGISTDPYMVFDVYGLQGMRTNLTNSYKLNNSIDASVTTGWNAGAGFVPVGTNVTPYSGDFDGGGFTISNLFINSTTLTYVGLFGYSTSQIKNVTLSNVDITGVGITGTNGTNGATGTTGAAPTAGGTGTAGNAGTILHIGALVGYNTGIISNVIVSGSVTGTGGTGGNSGNAGAGGASTGAAAG